MSRQAKKQLEGKHAKRQTIKKSQTGANKHVIKQKRVSLEDKCRFGLGVHSSMRLEYR